MRRLESSLTHSGEEPPHHTAHILPRHPPPATKRNIHNTTPPSSLTPPHAIHHTTHRVIPLIGWLNSPRQPHNGRCACFTTLSSFVYSLTGSLPLRQSHLAQSRNAYPHTAREPWVRGLLGGVEGQVYGSKSSRLPSQRGKPRPISTESGFATPSPLQASQHLSPRPSIQSPEPLPSQTGHSIISLIMYPFRLTS